MMLAGGQPQQRRHPEQNYRAVAAASSRSMSQSFQAASSSSAVGSCSAPSTRNHTALPVCEHLVERHLPAIQDAAVAA